MSKALEEDLTKTLKPFSKSEQEKIAKDALKYVPCTGPFARARTPAQEGRAGSQLECDHWSTSTAALVM